jgi:pimeloyl-ACP methyl ester carboxylesterase
MYSEFERLGGPAARDAAVAFWEHPNRESSAAYMKVCMPLYNRRGRSRDSSSRTLWNLDVTFHFASGEQRTMNLLPGLARVRCPTLVLAGEEDPITPVRESEDIVAALPPELVRFERFPNAGHGVVTDAPERFLAVVREFIAA